MVMSPSPPHGRLAARPGASPRSGAFTIGAAGALRAEAGFGGKRGEVQFRRPNTTLRGQGVLGWFLK